MERPDAAAPKADWRRWARTLGPVAPAPAARVVEHLQAFLGTFDGPVLGYLALPDEVGLDGLSTPVRCLPRLGDGGVLSIHLDDGRRERHAVGVEQPPAGLEVVDPAMVAAVLVPGRVFDRDGYRLGRGGGHYDRLLPQLGPGVPVVGVTVRDRIVDRLPREPHDVPMTHLADEHGLVPAG